MSAPAVLKGASITYLGTPWFLPKMQEGLRQFCLDWAVQNNVKFTLDSAQASDILSRAATAIQVKSGPSIIQLQAPPTAIAGALVDLSSLAKEIGDQQGGWIPAAAYNCAPGGKWIAIPLGTASPMMNYRQDWFKEAGYTAFPDTWDELLAAGRKLKAAGHPFGYPFTGSAPFDGTASSLIVLWAFGGQEWNADGSVALDSKGTLDALNFAIQFYKETCDPAVTAYTDATNNQAFLGGAISMTPNVNTIYLAARDSNPTMAAAMSHGIPPKGPAGRFNYAVIHSLGILDYVQGRDRDAAIAFLRDLLSVKNYANWIKEGEGFLLPTGPIYADLPIWSSDAKLAFARTVGGTGRPAGFALPGKNRAAGLMEDQVTIGKMFALACTSGNARTALDAALREIADIQKQAG